MISGAGRARLSPARRRTTLIPPRRAEDRRALPAVADRMQIDGLSSFTFLVNHLWLTSRYAEMVQDPRCHSVVAGLLGRGFSFVEGRAGQWRRGHNLGRGILRRRLLVGDLS